MMDADHSKLVGSVTHSPAHLLSISHMRFITGASIIVACVFALIAFKYFTRVPYKESINSFDTQMVVQGNGEVLVIETIVYDFGYNKKKGISRYIPLVNGHDSRLDINPLRVEDDMGQSYKYESFVEDDVFAIQIGDAEALVNGVKTYIITYKVSDVIVKYPNFQQIYWNVTGDQWSRVIKSATTSIILPGGNVNVVKIDCFTGPRGSTERNCRHEQTSTVENTNIFYATTKPLMLIEGFTILLDYTLLVQ